MGLEDSREFQVEDRMRWRLDRVSRWEGVSGFDRLIERWVRMCQDRIEFQDAFACEVAS